MQDHYILMADIIKSSRSGPGAELMTEFRTIVKNVGKQFPGVFLSPMTITLGDEFQGIVKGPGEGITVVLAMEEEILRQGKPFSLRYVFWRGPVDTPINKKNAHEMFGKGLSDARKALTEMKKNTSRRFLVKVTANDEPLNDLLRILQSFIDGWSPADARFVASFLSTDDYRKVAIEMNRDESAMWRRKRSLKIEEYNLMKKLIKNTLKQSPYA